MGRQTDRRRARSRCRVRSLALAIAAPAFPAAAGDIEVESIVVRGDRARAISESRRSLSREQLEDLHPRSAADVLRRLPGAHVPTNSRGESILFLRNAGERQVSVFFDGALLNVPWDNRIDLSLVPAGVIGAVWAATGPLSSQYGVNALGAVNLVPISLADREQHLALHAEAGSHGLWSGEAVLGHSLGHWEFVLAGGCAERDRDPLSDDAHLPLHQVDADARTNTDSAVAYVLGRAAARFSWGQIATTAMFSDAEKGIAPESDRTGSAVRFWRYPEVTNAMGVVHADVAIDADASLDLAGWVQDFSQTIAAYSNATYGQIATEERDADLTYGVRAVGTYRFGANKVALSYNALTSDHDQRDVNFLAGAPAAVLPPELSYRQEAHSVGLDYARPLSDAFDIEGGVGFDMLSFPRTGDKPPIADFDDFSYRLGAAWELTDDWRVRGGAGQKSRFPTMRELFGTALNRFLLNPDLRPERVSVAELGVERRWTDGYVSLTPFFQDVEDTIDQRAVGPLRQRINLKGSSVRGVELDFLTPLDECWSASGNVMWAEARRKRAQPSDPEFIAEKPEIVAHALLRYHNPSGFEAGVEIEHFGRAYSLGPTGAFVPLAISTQFNFYAAYKLDFGPSWAAKPELYVRVDNVSDEFVEPQAGLPAPGRWWRGGVRFAR